MLKEDNVKNQVPFSSPRFRFRWQRRSAALSGSHMPALQSRNDRSKYRALSTHPLWILVKILLALIIKNSWEMIKEQSEREGGVVPGDGRFVGDALPLHQVCYLHISYPPQGADLVTYGRVSHSFLSRFCE